MSKDHKRSAACGIALRPAASNGTLTGSSTGAPISTVMLPSASIRGSIMPLMVSTRMCDLSVSFFSITKRTRPVSRYHIVLLHHHRRYKYGSENRRLPAADVQRPESDQHQCQSGGQRSASIVLA